MSKPIESIGEDFHKAISMLDCLILDLESSCKTIESSNPIESISPNSDTAISLLDCVISEVEFHLEWIDYVSTISKHLTHASNKTYTLLTQELKSKNYKHLLYRLGISETQKDEMNGLPDGKYKYFAPLIHLATQELR